MYCVYWTVTDGETRTAHKRELGSHELTEALHFCEALRLQRREGAPLSMICMASEDSNSVGEQGVKAFDGFQADGVTPYDWKKRRI